MNVLLLYISIAYINLTYKQHSRYLLITKSQFTLYGTLSKKNQPDYKLAMKSNEAQTMYNQFLNMLKEGYETDKIHDGAFGEMMDVELVNDGPVTLVIDSRDAMIRKQLSSMSLTNEESVVDGDDKKKDNKI